jgi:hypothetical protein
MNGGGQHRPRLLFRYSLATYLTLAVLMLVWVGTASAEPSGSKGHVLRSTQGTYDVGPLLGPAKLLFVDAEGRTFLTIDPATKTIEWKGDQAEAAVQFWKAVERAWPICENKP